MRSSWSRAALASRTADRAVSSHRGPVTAGPGVRYCRPRRPGCGPGYGLGRACSAASRRAKIVSAHAGTRRRRWRRSSREIRQELAAFLHAPADFDWATRKPSWIRPWASAAMIRSSSIRPRCRSRGSSRRYGCPRSGPPGRPGPVPADRGSPPVGRLQRTGARGARRCRRAWRKRRGERRAGTWHPGGPVGHGRLFSNPNSPASSYRGPGLRSPTRPSPGEDDQSPLKTRSLSTARSASPPGVGAASVQSVLKRSKVGCRPGGSCAGRRVK